MITSVEEPSFYLKLKSSLGIPCSLYIDDRHVGELQLATLQGLAGVSNARRDEFHLAAAQAAVFVVAYTLSHLGYCLGLAKCVLAPQKRVKYLGFVCDTDKEAFYLPVDKQMKFLALVE